MTKIYLNPGKFLQLISSFIIVATVSDSTNYLVGIGVAFILIGIIPTLFNSFAKTKEVKK